MVSALNSHLEKAEQALDKADTEFAERAFAPFWETVHQSAEHLGAFNNAIKDIEKDNNLRCRYAANLSMAVSKFEIPERFLIDARPLADRLLSTVRKAQKDFQFAMIYQQYKTNVILHCGFGTLAGAIE